MRDQGHHCQVDERLARQLPRIAEGHLRLSDLRRARGNAATAHRSEACHRTAGRRGVVLLAGAVFVAAACSLPASPVGTPSRSAAPLTSGAPLESTAPTATAPAEASGALPSIALPSFNPDKDLEGLLPATFKGVSLEKRSIKDAEVLGQGPTLNTVVSALNLKATDVSVALAEDAAGTLGVTFEAIRFAGADSGRLLKAFEAATQDSGDLVGFVHLGGKDVVKANEGSGMGSFTYSFVRTDVVLRVTAADDAAADAALAIFR